MRVEVARPVVRDDTVHFAWTQSGPNPYQHANTFSFRYEGIDLARLSPAVFDEIFLGLQLRVFAAYDEPVEVVFTEPIAATSAAFWRAYHDAPRVSMGPLADVTTNGPWTARPVREGDRGIAVIFGGGKDSTLQAAMLAEANGPESVVAIRFVLPARLGAEEIARIEQRDEALVLRPARQVLGIATQRAWVDYIANLTRDGLRARPHFELFTLGFLPALLWWGVSLCTSGLPWTAYAIRRLGDGSVWFSYDQSRPEVLADLSAHLRHRFSVDLTLTNLHLFFNGRTALRLLIERYPRALPEIVVCNRAGVAERWCYECKKCNDYAVHGLALGFVDRRFDYNRWLGSDYVGRQIRYAESGVDLTCLGNAPWHRSLCSARQYTHICDDFATIDRRLIADRIGREARANLVTLHALFGNRAYPHARMAPAAAIDLLGIEPARQVAGIAAQHVPLVDPLPGPFFEGATEVDYDFTVRMPTRTGTLPHLRAGGPVG